MDGLKISKLKDAPVRHKLNIYNKPNKVYIPLVTSNNENVTVLVKKDDYVFKGSLVAKRKGENKINIFSSVSGKVVDFEEHTIFNGEKVKCIVIENDFKERIEKRYELRESLNSLTKKEFITTLEKCGIVGLGGIGFPQYKKYDIENKITTLIVNAVECEPYMSADYFIVKEKCEEILEMIDAILEINNIDRAIIAIKKSSKDLLNIINKYIGTYPKIKVILVPNYYSMGWERKLVKKLTGIIYDKYPVEKGVIVNNVSTIYAMYQALKLHKPMIERIVTFTGNGLKKPQNVLVKIGTNVNEVIDYIGGIYKTKETVMISDGAMMGHVVDELIVTPELKSVIITENNFEDIENTCIRCGKCVDACPAKICPVLIKDNLNNLDNLKQMNVEKCIECGLCSYICPAKINVRNYVRKAKKKVGK